MICALRERLGGVSRATIVPVLDCSCQALGSDRAVRAQLFPFCYSTEGGGA